jgi:polyhydroxyalkanoate synthase
MTVMETWLPIADALDRVTAATARARLHIMANGARLAAGAPPLAHIAGPASANTVVAEHPLAALRHYPARGSSRRAPVLVVASLINRYYVLDLLPGLSVIDKLNAAGHDVFVLDWSPVGARGPRLGFADYVDGAIVWGAAEAAARTGGEKVAVLGYCMGGTMAAMFAALHKSRVSSLMLLGAPIDFHASGQLATWTARGRFDPDLVADANGNMPPWLMQSGFRAMNPMEPLWKSLRLFIDGPNEDRLRHQVALEAWLDDNIAFPGGVYREYIRGLYQDNALIAGQFTVGDRRVDLAAIDMPLVVVVADRDHIAAPPSSEALLARVSSTEKQLVRFATGHIGMTTSRAAHAELWPKLIPTVR